VNALSLFAGIGGLELGLERAGMTVVGQVEIDPFCRRVLAKHWPEVPRHDDVQTCVEWWRTERRPRVDLVCGGFPCQPVSLAGRRQAQTDSRWLWPAFHEVVCALRPRYVLVENVPGLLSPWRDGDGFWNPPPIEEVVGDLARLGYDAEWDSLAAAHFDALHLRKRVILVAYPASGGRDERPNGGHQEPPGERVVLQEHTGGVRRVVADAESDGWRQGRAGRSAGDGTNWQTEWAETLAYADRTTRHGARGAGETVFRPSTVKRPGRRRSGSGGQWATEPDVGRVANGIPSRLDRLRALGNAVVPQVAEHVGRLILDHATAGAAPPDGETPPYTNADGEPA